MPVKADQNEEDLTGNSGAQGRIRTTDTRIFSPLLYQLSYLGKPCTGDRKAAL